MSSAPWRLGSTLAAVLLCGTACDSCQPPPGLPPGAQVPDVYCPGGPTCAPSSDDALHVGVAKREVTPRGFEIARPGFLEDRHSAECLPEMQQFFGIRRCGMLHLNFQRDCGRDQICADNIGPNLESGVEASDGIDNDRDGLTDAEDVEYTGPDADRSEGDGVMDFFLDCGLDRLCPGNVPETGAEASDGIDNDGDGAVDGEDVTYPGPDSGEGDGEFQGMWIAGFDSNRPAVGVHDPLWVRAFVVQSGDTTVAILSLDAIGFFYDDVVKVREAVTQRLRASGADVDYVLLSSTHTHEAPDTMGQWGMANPAVSSDISDLPGCMPGHIAFIIEQATEAVAEAVAQLTPARLEVAETKTGYTSFIGDYEDPNIIDDRMLVIRAVGRDDNVPIGTLVSWANHPESLGSLNNFVSSDYADGLRRAVEDGLPAGPGGPALPGAGGICVYLQGMVGGLMGPNKFDFVGYDGTAYPYRNTEGRENPKTFTRTEAYGQNIGAVALAALQDAESVVRGRVTVRAKALKIPVDNVIFHFALMRGLFDRQVYDWRRDDPIDDGNRPHLMSEVAVVEIGPVTLLTLPGEGFPELAIGGYDGSHTPGGLDSIVSPNNPNPPDVSKAPGPPYLLDLADSKYKFMVGLANDEIGYLVPPWRFELADNPWVDDAPGDHYCETNSTGIETVPRLEQMLKGLILFPLP
ncbi:MAG: neutral/alkaline non-lysosomal ceramidase N-terminal domain-containing protein [Pseudomonadota bacterium]